MDRKWYIILFLAVTILFAIPFMIGGEFEGADVSGGNALEEMGVTPWFNPIFEPPSGEVETGFFALQAAIGGLIVGYFLGNFRGQAQARRREKMDEDTKTTTDSSK